MNQSPANLPSATPNAAYTSPDIASLTTLARIQGGIGSEPPTKSGLLDVMAALDELSTTGYSATGNAEVKGWLDSLFGALAATPTCYGAQVPGLFVGYHYMLFLRDKYGPNLVAMPYVMSQFVNVRINKLKLEWKPLLHPSFWGQAVFRGFQSEAVHNRVILLKPAPVKEAIANQANLFDPQNWTDSGRMRTTAEPLWNAQSQRLNDLTQKAALEVDDYVTLLFLLVAMANSAKPDHKELAYRIGNCETASPENPNATFAGQLVYLALMAWADPQSHYQMTHAQLLSAMHNLTLSAPSGDTASELLRRTFKEQAALVQSDATYPLSDPDNPQPGFLVRKADTLTALNRSWAALFQPSPSA